jgi:putative ABC transport system permease protein
LLSSYLRVTHIELGFETDDVMLARVTLPPERYAAPAARDSMTETDPPVWHVEPRQALFVEGVLDRIRQVSGVIHAGAINRLPATNTGWRGVVSAQGAPKPPTGESYFGFLRPVAGDYFATMKIPLLAGRRFSPADQMGSDDVAIIDEALARKLWPSANPLGESIVIRDGSEDRFRPFRVVGVVNSVRMLDFDRPALNATISADNRFVPNTVYLPYRRQTSTYSAASIITRMQVWFIVRSAKGRSIPAADLLHLVREADSESLVSVQSLTNYVGGRMGEQRFLAQMVMAFGILGLTLAVTGIYGVVAYSVTRRVREVGIRMAMGARRSDIVGLFVTYVLRYSAIGLTLGIAAALAFGRVLSGFLYQITPRDPSMLLGAAGFLLATTALAAWIPSRRAARVDLVTTLRTE